MRFRNILAGKGVPLTPGPGVMGPPEVPENAETPVLGGHGGARKVLPWSRLGLWVIHRLPVGGGWPSTGDPRGSPVAHQAVQGRCAVAPEPRFSPDRACCPNRANTSLTPARNEA